MENNMASLHSESFVKDYYLTKQLTGTAQATEAIWAYFLIARQTGCIFDALIPLKQLVDLWDRVEIPADFARLNFQDPILKELAVEGGFRQLFTGLSRDLANRGGPLLAQLLDSPNLPSMSVLKDPRGYFINGNGVANHKGRLKISGAYLSQFCDEFANRGLKAAELCITLPLDPKPLLNLMNKYPQLRVILEGDEFEFPSQLVQVWDRISAPEVGRLSFEQAVEDAHVDQITRAFPNLLELNINGANLSDIGLIRLVREYPYLSSLSTENCLHITPAALSDVITYCWMVTINGDMPTHDSKSLVWPPLRGRVAPSLQYLDRFLTLNR